MDEQGLHTICEEARCPNVWECWNNRTATFLILGDICTRRCHYCAVTTGRPEELDLEEPNRVANAIHKLGLRHAVITSVNRDELPDGGASMFADTLRQVRRKIPTCTLEVLIPDFQGSEAALAEVMAEHPDILNHNIETVPRLFPSIRPQGKYDRSLQVLRMAKEMGGRTKSGLIAGLGESLDEIREVMRDLRSRTLRHSHPWAISKAQSGPCSSGAILLSGRISIVQGRRTGDGIHPRGIRPLSQKLLPRRATDPTAVKTSQRIV